MLHLLSNLASCSCFVFLHRFNHLAKSENANNIQFIDYMNLSSVYKQQRYHNLDLTNQGSWYVSIYIKPYNAFIQSRLHHTGLENNAINLPWI